MDKLIRVVVGVKLIDLDEVILSSDCYKLGTLSNVEVLVDGITCISQSLDKGCCGSSQTVSFHAIYIVVI